MNAMPDLLEFEIFAFEPAVLGRNIGLFRRLLGGWLTGLRGKRGRAHDDVLWRTHGCPRRMAHGGEEG